MNHEQHKPVIVGVNGSPFARSCVTATLLQNALDEASTCGATTDTIHLAEHVPGFYDGRRNGELAPWFLPLLARLQAADGIICATPVYWGGPSPQMTTFLANFTPTCDGATYPLQGRVAAYMAICEEDGAQSAIDRMAETLNHLGVGVIPFGMHWYNKNMAEKSERQWQVNDIHTIGRRITLAAQISRTYKDYDWDHVPQTRYPAAVAV